MTFRLTRPTRGAAPVMVEVPHAGLLWPDSLRRGADATERDVLADSDPVVDDLFAGAPHHGATLLCATHSRYVVDLNRDATDVDARVVTLARGAPPATTAKGVVWRESGTGRKLLRRRLTHAEFDARIRAYHQPYHAALEFELVALRTRHGRVVLVSGHSMPSVPPPGTAPEPRPRADVVVGTRGRTTADARFIDAADAHFRKAGLRVAHDEPYKGGATTIRWGRPADGYHAIQIELNRAAYLDEARIEPRRAEAARLARICASLADAIARA